MRGEKGEREQEKKTMSPPAAAELAATRRLVARARSNGETGKDDTSRARAARPARAKRRRPSAPMMCAPGMGGGARAVPGAARARFGQRRIGKTKKKGSLELSSLVRDAPPRPRPAPRPARRGEYRAGARASVGGSRWLAIGARSAARARPPPRKSKPKKIELTLHPPLSAASSLRARAPPRLLPPPSPRRLHRQAELLAEGRAAAVDLAASFIAAHTEAGRSILAPALAAALPPLSLPLLFDEPLFLLPLSPAAAPRMRSAARGREREREQSAPERGGIAREEENNRQR